MVDRKNKIFSQRNLLEILLPWLVLVPLLTFTYAFFVKVPYIGFTFSRGEISFYSQITPPGRFQIGDRLIRLGETMMADFQGDLQLGILEDVQTGDIIPISLERDGQIIHLEWAIPGVNGISLLERLLIAPWWLSYVFWAAGTSTLLFIRPKDSRWRLLIASSYLTALWLGAGVGLSSWHIWHTAIILRSTLWSSLPFYIHLHWEYPQPIKPTRWVLWLPLYLVGVGFAITEWFHWIPKDLFILGFTLAITVSAVFLVVRWLIQRDDRRDIRLLGMALVLIMLPPFGVSLVIVLGLDPPSILTGSSILAFPALPGAYFLVAYRRQFRMLEERIKRLSRFYLGLVLVGTLMIILLAYVYFQGSLDVGGIQAAVGMTLIAMIGAIIGFAHFLVLPALSGETYKFGRRPGELEIRANQLLALFLFAILMGATLVVGIGLANLLVSFPGDSLVIAVVASLFASGITALGLPPFRKFINRVVLGIKLDIDEVLTLYSNRIITSLKVENLVPILRDELLPSLLIRQSVMLRLKSGELQSIFSLGLEGIQIPAELDIHELKAWAGTLIPRSGDIAGRLPWLRLVLPLMAGSRTIGLWLFGRRDPDDYYAPAEIHLLETFANQTAIALNYVDQANQLRSMYQANIDQVEEARKDLARALHDKVLNRIVTLPFFDDMIQSPGFHEDLSQITTRIRGMITFLRPAMLEYGLWTAFDEFVDELSDRAPVETKICLEIPRSSFRYDNKIEEHLYRIVQQAGENALQHAQAGLIRLNGAFGSNQVHLVIEDDGIGMGVDPLDIPRLVSERHFGLAGMFERANLIGAELQIESAPGKGTRILLRWDAYEGSMETQL